MRYVIIAMLALLAGCGKKQVIKTEPYATVQPAAEKSETGMRYGNSAFVNEKEQVRSVTVYFDLNSAEPQRTAELFEFVMKGNGRTAYSVTGHACPIGTDEHNMSLSMRRAKGVREAMAQSGVSPDRIRVYAKGESEPVTGDVERYHLNRRVEVTQE